jgi:hypothetical protein
MRCREALELEVKLALVEEKALEVGSDFRREEQEHGSP